ncbi:uncharacterized protein LOC113231954 [Hyposmocoma kahamanoa]|uniref:uncharacterized protein LOC113231954 n=1 Tax=Hyposmocoma kahamanoa TaxID=1477025 RepID=UPI000E6DA101|nr:uncharacterized protein LOC113231954 [Hyposmocoma kahamanoa]
MDRVYFIGASLVLFLDMSISQIYTKEDTFPSRVPTLGVPHYLVPPNGGKRHSHRQNDCRFGCYVKEDPSDPEVKMAAKIALKEYILDSRSRLKDLDVDRVIDAKRQIIGFLNHNHRLNFLARSISGCEMYSFFCPAPQKCKAEVNVKNNIFRVVKVVCQPRVGKIPDQPSWDW